MYKRHILSAIALVALLPVNAQINSPATDGYIARGLEMFENKNYIGCTDQLSNIDREALTDSQRETVDWTMAEAAFATDGSRSINRFVAFLTVYPYSLHRYEALMRIGDCNFESSYPEALKIYQKVDRSCLPADKVLDLDYRMAYCYLKLADFDKALPLFDRLSQTKTYGNAARFYKGYIAYARSQYREAEQLFKTVNSSVAPGNMADFYLAQIYYRDGDYKKTLSTARALLRKSNIDASYMAEANRLAGESLFQTGDAAAAIPYLKKYVAATTQPELSALYILGISQYNNGDYSDAVGSLKAVSDGNDAMAQSACLYIGQALMKLGDKAAALLAFDKAIKNPVNAGVTEAAYYNYAVAKFSGANIPFGSSVATFEDFLRRYPDSRYAPDIQNYIVDGYVSERNYEQALASINRMKNPGNRIMAAKQKVLYALGASALASGNAKTALVYLREADTLASHDAQLADEVKLLMGEALYHTGDYDSARKSLKAYIAKAKKNAINLPLARYDLGYTDFAQKNYTQAAESFRQVVDAPGNLTNQTIADAYNRLGDISYYASDFTNAAALYQKAYQTNPASGDYALFQTAIMKGYERDHKAKIADLIKLREEFPSSTLLADAMLEMTASYIQIGDNASAIATYRRLISEYPNTAQGRQGHLQLALTLLNDGKHDEAIETYRDIIRLYPTSEEAREATEALKRIAAEDGTLNDLVAFMATVPDAPAVDVAEVEKLAFENAEHSYLSSLSTSALEKYISQYPQGSYRAKALSYLLENAMNAAEDKQLKYAEMLVSEYPDNNLSEPAYIVKATSLYEEGNTQAALETWRALEQRASSSKTLNTARTGIMRSGRDLGDHATVIAAADALLASSTLGAEDKNEAIFSKALALDQTGKSAEARELWKTIAPMTDDLYGAKSAYYMAQSYFADGDNDKAKTAVEALVESGTPHAYWLARGFILLSDIYQAQGKDFEAREYLNALRENYPGNESDIFMMIDNRLNK